MEPESAAQVLEEQVLGAQVWVELVLEALELVELELEALELEALELGCRNTPWGFHRICSSSPFRWDSASCCSTSHLLQYTQK